MVSEMDRELSKEEEVRKLADALFDRRMTPLGMQRLDELITSDLGCLQAYLERIDFHGEVLDQARERVSHAQTGGAWQEFFVEKERRDAVRSRWMVGGTLVGAILVLVTIGILANAGAFLPAPVGTIAGLTADLESNRGLKLGQVLRKGGIVNLDSGVATIHMPHVVLDIVGPAKVRMKSASQVYLQSGIVKLLVGKGGEGFTVLTEDAEIVDLGTEFLVEHNPKTGTQVNVRRGRTKASLLNRHGLPVNVLELTANRAAQLSSAADQAKEINFDSRLFEEIDVSRGGILRLDGNLRTSRLPIRSFRANRTNTPNHMLVIPERQHVQLPSDMTINTLEGQKILPAGSIVSSYLVHFDPSDLGYLAPRGGVTFFGEIFALIGESKALNATDQIFGLPDTFYESQEFRELELDEDEFQISDDRKTVSFYFGTSPPEYLDEVRIIVLEK